MRRIITTMVGVGALALAVPMASPASAGCSSDGSVPGSAHNVYMIGTGGNDTTFYVDDRDYADLDEDNEAGGIWVYQESNSQGWLQTGGDQFAMAAIPGTVPRIEPIQVLPPDDSRPVFKSGTLFPNGFGGGSWAEELGGHDACSNTTGTPDRIIF